MRMKFEDLPKNCHLISRDAFDGFLIKLKDDSKDIMTATVIPPNCCPPSMVEGSWPYKNWQGRGEEGSPLYKEDMEADDWFYYY